MGIRINCDCDKCRDILLDTEEVYCASCVQDLETKIENLKDEIENLKKELEEAIRKQNG